MRVGVVGVGIAGLSHLFDLVSDNRFEVVAVCGRRANRAIEVAGIFGVRASYTDAEAMLECEALDGVVVTTPPVATPDILKLVLTLALQD